MGQPAHDAAMAGHAMADTEPPEGHGAHGSGGKLSFGQALAIVLGTLAVLIAVIFAVGLFVPIRF